VYLGLHDSGEEGVAGCPCTRWFQNGASLLQYDALLMTCVAASGQQQPILQSVPTCRAEVAAAMAYDRAAIREKGVDAATNLHLAEFAEELG